MNLSAAVAAYVRSPRLKAKLVKGIKYTENGAKHIMKRGVVSDLLIDKGDGQYHFEAQNTAIMVTRDEIEFI